MKDAWILFGSLLVDNGNNLRYVVTTRSDDRAKHLHRQVLFRGHRRGRQIVFTGRTTLDGLRAMEAPQVVLDAVSGFLATPEERKTEARRHLQVRLAPKLAEICSTLQQDLLSR